MRIVLLLAALASALVAFGQTEKKDSIEAKDLNEVVVEAQMQRTSPTSTTYTPTGKQKQHEYENDTFCNISWFDIKFMRHTCR